MFQPLDELLREESYWTTGIQLQLYREIETYLKDNDMSRKDFAKELGVSKSYVSQILNGDFDHKVSKLVRLALAMKKVPHISFTDLEDEIMSAKGATCLPDMHTYEMRLEDQHFDALPLDELVLEAA